MEQLIYNMHKEAMELKGEVAELKGEVAELYGILDEIRDMICMEENKIARNSYNDRSDVEKAELKCADIRRALGDAVRINREAEAILKEREDAERNRSSEDNEGSSAE